MEECRLSANTVKGYVSALIDLYQAQVSRNQNDEPHPRGYVLKQLQKQLRLQERERRREQFEDQGNDTLLDGYNEQEFLRICENLWDSKASNGETSQRTLVDFMIGHYLCTRGEDRRAAELSHLSTIEFPGEGTTPCWPLVVTVDGGKTNQQGKKQTMAAIRNRDVRICPQAALAYSFLLRWDLGTEPFPTLSERRSWYRTRVVKRSNRNLTGSLSYNSQRRWTVRALKSAAVATSKATHSQRGSSARMAELRGVSEEQIRRAGQYTYLQYNLPLLVE